MLARTFKTAAELKISEPVYDALIKVLHMLEDGELTWVGKKNPKLKGGEHRFNMNIWKEYYGSCGSIGCIGGTVEMMLIGKVRCDTLHSELTTNPGLMRLFYPQVVLPTLNWISAEQAIFALRNYLCSGYPHWQDAVEAAPFAK